MFKLGVDLWLLVDVATGLNIWGFVGIGLGMKVGGPGGGGPGALRELLKFELGGTGRGVKVGAVGRVTVLVVVRPRGRKIGVLLLPDVGNGRGWKLGVALALVFKR